MHFHAVIRLDGPDGPTDPPPAGLTHDALRDAITTAARAATLTTARPDGTPLVLGWGTQLDLRPVTATAARAARGRAPGEITDAALAGYIAKYATKSTGAVDAARAPTGPSATATHIAYLDVSPHHRRMIETAWQLGGLPQYERAEPAPLGAHARLPRPLPHQVPRATRPPSPPCAAERRTWRLRDDLDQLAADTDDHGDDVGPVDLDTVTVINDWRVVHIGHRDHAERELAAGHRRTQPHPATHAPRTTRRAA